MDSSNIILVLSGGVSLGAYQAGAYAAMHGRFGERVKWIAGSSVGAVNAALIAGNPPDRRVDRLLEFWNGVVAPLPGPPVQRGPLRHLYNWLSVLHTRLAGRPGVFLPRLPWLGGSVSLYTLGPLAQGLRRLADFDRLNAGAVRLSVVATDIATGEAVVFDTAEGNGIGPEHLLASAGFLPEFEPVEIGGRLLGDGGLVANAPVEVVLGGGAPDSDCICFVIDLFARDAGRPCALEDAAARRRDLIFANQTFRALVALRREHALRRLLAETLDAVPAAARKGAKLVAAEAEARRGTVRVAYLSYLPAAEEAGPDMQFDFSRATLSDRWEAGAADMARALEMLERERKPENGFSLIRVRREAETPAPPSRRALRSGAVRPAG